MNNLKTFINKLTPATEHEIKPFTSLFTETQLKKNEYFAKEGEFASNIGFINKGVLRAFYRNNEGVEYNKTLFVENNFVAAYSALITKQKNLIYIQSLTDCSLLIADYEKVSRLYDKHPKIERFARMLAEHFFVIKETREIELVMLDAKARYKLFQQRYPSLENIIPQYQIASYLGITPTQLSRIRALS